MELARPRIAGAVWGLAVSACVTVGGCARILAPVPAGERLRELQVPSSTKASLPARIDVVVWNIEKARGRQWSLDFDRIVAGAELVLLQEIGPRSSMVSGLSSHDELQWQVGASYFRWGEDEFPTGVATGAVARPKSAVVVHSPTKEPFVRTPKAGLVSTYAIDEHREALLVINLHGINFRPASHLETQLYALDDLLSSHRGPVIFGGDLNTHHRPRMEVLSAFAQEHGLTSVFPNPVQAGNRRRAKDGRTRHLGWPLDHLYVRGVKIEYARVLADIRSSDHMPLKVGVVLDP